VHDLLDALPGQVRIPDVEAIDDFVDVQQLFIAS
jgi:hypothetical protein